MYNFVRECDTVFDAVRETDKRVESLAAVYKRLYSHKDFVHVPVSLNLQEIASSFKLMQDILAEVYAPMGYRPLKHENTSDDEGFESSELEIHATADKSRKRQRTK